MNEPVTIEVCDSPGEGERAAICGGLAAFNADQGYPGDLQPVCVLLKDAEGAILGGLWGKTVYDWMFVEYLVVPEQMRGRDLGTRLMEEAEVIARGRGCAGSWLTTFSFQARRFYEGLGYELFGELPHSPRENVRLFLRKFYRLDDPRGTQPTI